MSVKETEAVLGVIKVIILSVLAEIGKTGFQWVDLLAFLKSPDLEAAVQAAVDGIGDLPSELANLGLMDDLSLARYAYNMAMDIMDQIKANKKAS